MSCLLAPNSDDSWKPEGQARLCPGPWSHCTSEQGLGKESSASWSNPDPAAAEGPGLALGVLAALYRA